MPHETPKLPGIALYTTMPIEDRLATWTTAPGMTKHMVARRAIAVLDEQALVARRALVRIFWDDPRFDDLPKVTEAEFVRIVGEAVGNRSAAIALRALWVQLNLADSLKQRETQNPEARLKEIAELTTEVSRGIPGMGDVSIPLVGQAAAVKVVSFGEAMVTVDMAKLEPLTAEVFGLTAASQRLHQALHDSNDMRSLYGSVSLAFEDTLTSMRYCALGNALGIWDERSLPEFAPTHVLADVIQAALDESRSGRLTGSMLVLT